MCVSHVVVAPLGVGIMAKRVHSHGYSSCCCWGTRAESLRTHAQTCVHYSAETTDGVIVSLYIHDDCGRRHTQYWKLPQWRRDGGNNGCQQHAGKEGEQKEEEERVWRVKWPLRLIWSQACPSMTTNWEKTNSQEGWSLPFTQRQPHSSQHGRGGKDGFKEGWSIIGQKKGKVIVVRQLQ